eukprot:CAMPEP_0197889204 /NCGR_PEP_ID=MMETSP1439-20131203/23802_1 /TAXON_ID=66791 /ORGANISM="Gonyaulax spinifera, Strain CCMP409" /LENGTH=215 /DNA_ID=CAMNT_0043509163 /DNA_START=63 /DNA_END=710 /DNA_ORIENTATION=+
MARRSGSSLPACVAIAAACGTALRFVATRQAEAAFVPPQQLRGSAAAGLAAAVVAGSVLGPLPADAVTAKFSIFGFGDGNSDPYSANDADGYSPYSQFSSGKDAIYKKGTDERVQRKKTALNDSFQRLEKIPKFIRNRQGEEIKSTLSLQLYVMRANMEYLSGARDSPAFKKARDFFQDIADLGVGARDKRWSLADDSFSAAMAALREWKGLVAY